VAGGTDGVGTVLLELLADGGGAMRVWINRGDAGRRGRDGLTENAVIEPDPAHDRRSHRAVRRNLEDASLVMKPPRSQLAGMATL